MAEVEDVMKVRSRTYRYTVNFEEAEDGVIIATVPLLRGCVSYGYTIEEAEGNIREAIECYIETLQEMGEEIPVEESVSRRRTSKVVTVSPFSA